MNITFAKHLLWLKTAGLVLGCFLMGDAMARPGNSERYPVGAEHTGMGGAGIALGEIPWLNPAGVGRADAAGLSASLSVYGITRERAPNLIEIDAGGGVNGALVNSAIDLFPANVEFVTRLGTTGAVSHGVGVSVVIPDFDQFDGVLEVPADDVAFAINLRREFTNRTFWVVPAWGACAERIGLCWGASPAVAINLQSDLTVATQSVVFADDSTLDTSFTSRTNMLAAALGGYFGAQYSVTPRFTMGITVRTPVLGLLSSGKILSTDSSSFLDAAGVSLDPQDNYVDRVEVTNPRVRYEQPWRFGMGVAYVSPNATTLALDVRVSLGVPSYAVLTGPGGNPTVQPVRPDGTVVPRALDIEQRVELKPIANANAGIRVPLSEKISFLTGLFTDFSATPRSDILANGNDVLNRVGVTLGGGLAGKHATTWLTVLGTYGWGETFGLAGPLADVEDVIVDQRAYSVMVLLGGTASLSDEESEPSGNQPAMPESVPRVSEPSHEDVGAVRRTDLAAELSERESDFKACLDGSKPGKYPLVFSLTLDEAGTPRNVRLLGPPRVTSSLAASACVEELVRGARVRAGPPTKIPRLEVGPVEVLP